MSIINKLAEKIGVDKVLHFLGGAVITATMSNILSIQEEECGVLVLSAALIGMIVTGILELFKEYFLDDCPDGKDILATMLGALYILMVNGIGLLFQWLS